ncbi:Uncharacterised protein [Bordetella pertussis]|nr:Uncharacterised protein [Bordetella pertussis]
MLLHRVLISLATGVLTLGVLGAAHADAYPTKPIRSVSAGALTL